VKELIKTTANYLRKKCIDEPRLTTELLLAHALEMKRVSLYLNFDKPLREEELSTFRNFIKRRLANEPVQYITGLTGFMGLDIETKKGVFIPRQETEILVSEVKNWLEKQGFEKFVLYDIGTGTGAIAISFAQFFNNAHIFASDISEVAIKCAHQNTEKHNFGERVTFLSGDLFSPFVNVEKADIIVSNPPYISIDEIANLPDVVKKEPMESLDGGKDGLHFIGKIIEDAKNFLKPNGLLAIEIGINQAESVKNLFEQEDTYEDLRIIPDLRGIKRVATAQKYK
ncbi:peptide chain release factor N(5)-glutamine methyltransferase, partial [candidate division WOR-3 bacterium]|nr:peptide chain release factor N(5)-glutamine methyltransferase [candidate division WOR-3 bacterium]